MSFTPTIHIAVPKINSFILSHALQWLDMLKYIILSFLCKLYINFQLLSNNSNFLAIKIQRKIWKIE